MKIGLSLSFCISDILRGDVKEAEVEKIITSTSCKNDSEFAVVVDYYCRNYSTWRKNQQEASRLAWKFWTEGKIEQPRLTENKDSHPGINDGNWIES